jgi:2-dehydro-3-deoxygluconokinase
MPGAASMKSIVGFGEVLLRLKSPGHERLLQSPSLEATFGGAEFNALAALATWGIPTQLVTVLPQGALGDAALREIRRHGVGTTQVVRGPGRLGLYFLEAGAGQRASSVLYDRSGSAMATLDAAKIPWRRILRNAGWLHLSGITPALGAAPLRAAHAAAMTAQALRVPVSVDVNYRAQLWLSSAVSANDALRPLIAHATVVFAGPGDAAVCVTGRSDHSLKSPRHAFDHFAGELLRQNRRLRLVAGTLRGSSSAEDQTLFAGLRTRRQECLWSRSHELHGVVDRIGAGDAFAAGLIFGELQGWAREQSLEYATAAWVLKHSVPSSSKAVIPDACGARGLTSSRACRPRAGSREGRRDDRGTWPPASRRCRRHDQALRPDAGSHP